MTEFGLTKLALVASPLRLAFSLAGDWTKQGSFLQATLAAPTEEAAAGHSSLGPSAFWS